MKQEFIIYNKPLDKLDIEILYVLCTNKQFSSLSSFKIKDIINHIESSFAYYTFVNRIKKLVNSGYIANGFKDGNANTYYLTSKGIKFLEDNVFNKEDIYEDEEE